MRGKERPWVITKKGLIHKVKKDHEGPKSQKEGKKERNSNNKKKKKDPGQARGYVARRRIPVRPEDIKQGSQSG